MQHQTTYYRTVPVSDKPKRPDLYHTLVENESLGIEGLPCHNNYIGNPNGGYWEIDGESKVTHYLQPIPIPEAKELKQIRDAFQWTFDNMGTPHTSDHFNVPANAIEQLDNLIALFASQHGEQETENKWMEAGLRLVAELYKKHRFILKNLDVANEDKNIFLYRLGISTEHMDNH